MVEKIVNVSGKEVRFKSTAATMRIYRNNFKSDMLADVFKLQKTFNKKKTAEEQFDAIDLGIFEQLAWAMAKTADPNTKPIDNWLDDFETFAIQEILPVLLELLTDNLQSINAPKN